MTTRSGDHDQPLAPFSTRPETVEIILDSRRHLQSEAGFALYGDVILENHLHPIVGITGSEPGYAALQGLHRQANHCP